ncbi:MAG: FAD:protein FMN transferase [Desulfomicrobium sp.]|uniref:FAD:protein FMN transferase n=1 Tax=Hoeflea sp. TaxID=1940281 RepID=UPI0025C68183|nr:FAD:protein FMN transferase [Hoeflea sp.]MBU4530833.1 FAD:protein FMN transferase [Alphaproteobacteria bacterium]MBV1712591.1 FAD:protein FMN transferase [Desulfomicrobium sp.]MBU4542963.1 FAD:protein FMN transferase [Alphaproteobacteria bacterium]MBU4549806.1 FAD:protein FMN transferase [Alphaproteobacteria bacterium]MBV1783614.1 FAD:protein FMN transferase [Hoeflea sp.]
MSKMSIDPVRHAPNGPTMGTRWSALFFAPPEFDPATVQADLQAAVDAVDAQMSTWRPDSDLMCLNAAPVGAWQDIPSDLARVLTVGLAIGRASGGAFDIGQGEAVRAWGFGPATADPQAIRAAMQAPHRPVHAVLELDGGRVRKIAPISLDLNGIAKGHGVDRLAEVLSANGILDALVGIDGEMRAMGLGPGGRPWTVAVEAPDHHRRAPHSILTLQDVAVATSGDYRHWVTVQGRDLSHTMDPARGAPLLAPPASVTVIAPTCAEADAWATALMVKGVDAGADLARQAGIDALFLTRDDTGVVQGIGVGKLFSSKSAATAPAVGD